MEMLGTETFVGRDSYPAIGIVGYRNPDYSGLDWRGLKSRLRPWKSAQADSASDRVGLNRLACLEQGIYPRRNQRKCRVWKHLLGGISIPPLVLSGMETQPFRFALAGTQVPPQTMEVRSSGLRPSRFQPTCMP